MEALGPEEEDFHTVSSEGGIRVPAGHDRCVPCRNSLWPSSEKSELDKPKGKQQGGEGKGKRMEDSDSAWGSHKHGSGTEQHWHDIALCIPRGAGWSEVSVFLAVFMLCFIHSFIHSLSSI